MASTTTTRVTLKSECGIYITLVRVIRPVLGMVTLGIFTFLTALWLAACMSYPEGMLPGDKISGNEGEYFRYSEVIVKPPDDEDRVLALRMADDVRCKVCEVLLRSFMEKAESLSEDHLMDQFDGEANQPATLTGTPQANRVAMKRKGCNKHFKDEVLLKGWSVRKCPQDDPLRQASEITGHVSEQIGRKAKTWCLERRSTSVSQGLVETFSVSNEAVFYSCEHTIARYGQELAAYLSENTANDMEDHEGLIERACQDVAACAGKSSRSKKKGRRKGSSNRREL